MYNLEKATAFIDDNLPKKRWFPVEINPRLRTTCARVLYNSRNKAEDVKCLQISKRYLETASDEEIEQTLLHEIIHCLLSCNDAHGPKFKQYCKLFNLSPSNWGPIHTPEKDEGHKKTEVVCNECGHVIVGYDRFTQKRKQEAKFLACPHCYSTDTSVIRNW